MAYYYVTSDNVGYRKKSDMKWWNRFSTVKERGTRKLGIRKCRELGVFIPYSQLPKHFH